MEAEPAASATGAAELVFSWAAAGMPCEVQFLQLAFFVQGIFSSQTKVVDLDPSMTRKENWEGVGSLMILAWITQNIPGIQQFQHSNNQCLCFLPASSVPDEKEREKGDFTSLLPPSPLPTTRQILQQQQKLELSNTSDTMPEGLLQGIAIWFEQQNPFTGTGDLVTCHLI